MDDYISREELWKKLDALECVDTGDETDAVLRVDALLAVENLPAADVKSVVHAHWIMPNNDDRPMPECSNCGWYVDTGGVKDFTYCPNCGAIMREE